MSAHKKKKSPCGRCIFRYANGSQCDARTMCKDSLDKRSAGLSDQFCWIHWVAQNIMQFNHDQALGASPRRKPAASRQKSPARTAVSRSPSRQVVAVAASRSPSRQSPSRNPDGTFAKKNSVSISVTKQQYNRGGGNMLDDLAKLMNDNIFTPIQRLYAT